MIRTASRRRVVVGKDKGPSLRPRCKHSSDSPSPIRECLCQNKKVTKEDAQILQVVQLHGVLTRSILKQNSPSHLVVCS